MKRVNNYTIGTAKARSGDVVKSWGYLCEIPEALCAGR